MEPTLDTQRVHVVNDAGGRVVCRSSAIQRESERAIYLEEALVPTGGYYPKRLFIKGVDIIAYSREMALRLYVQQIEARLVDMERVAIDFRRRLQEGHDQLQALTEGALGEGLTPESATTESRG